MKEVPAIASSGPVSSAVPIVVDNFLPGLALALAIGLLIGIERGWRLREEEPGSRVAGVRTFTLLGLLGGLVGFGLAGPMQALMILAAGAAVVAMIVGYFEEMRREGRMSATSAVASVLTLVLGAMASSGHMALASVGAGAALVLLASRERLHRALDETSAVEMRALVRLALVIFVILPLLPDAPLGPYALNPRRIWTVVVITGGISFVGYGLIRLLGGRRGILATSVVGALVSSTAVTLECARRMRGGEAVSANQAGIIVASTIMMLRASFLVSVLTPHIIGNFLPLIVPAIVASAAASALLVYRSRSDDAPLPPGAVKPPSLAIALFWGALVLAMAAAAGWSEQHMRGSGAAVVALGGLFDVDSAIAALGTLPAGTLSPRLSAFAVATPVIFNTVLKAGMALGIGGRRAWLPAALLMVTAGLIGGTILIRIL